MRVASPTFRTLPLAMVGGSNFGRYPKISIEETWNMIISDNWLVPYAGYIIAAFISGNGEGRGIYSSVKYNHMLIAVNQYIYTVDDGLAVNQIGTLNTDSGDVYFAENNNNQIAIADTANIYIFDYGANTFSVASTDFSPAYIEFQDGYFIAATATNLTGQAQWRLSAFNDGTSWPDDANHDGSLQTKPTNCKAVIKIPGQGGSVFVFGSTVTESWYDTGAQLFPYQRSNFFNVDYGCLNQATIATLENTIVWLAANEKSGPFIMYSQGGTPQKISTDGIDFKLAQLTNPSNSYGFLFRQDGHMIYQFTFPDDNQSYIFDFNTQKFSQVCDQNMNYHIAKRVVFFNNKYYFISFADGNLYELNSQFTTYQSAYSDPNTQELVYVDNEIPRIRICPTLRLPSTEPFVIQNLNFVIEQGINVTEEPARVDMSISIDGGTQWSSYDGAQMQQLPQRMNRFVYYNLGWSNEFTPQFRFWGRGRFVLSNGEVGIYQ